MRENDPMYELTSILTSQKLEFEFRLTKPYISRIIKQVSLDNDLIKVILGPRRCGKSFYGAHLINTVRPFGYANLDDEKLAKLNNLDELMAGIKAVYHSPCNLLFDEIQNIEGWELFVNRLQREGFRLILTGSNAHLLSAELATHLTGRHIPIVMFPFSFSEYCTTIKADTSDVIAAVHHCNEYLSIGGYPEPLMSTIDRRDYMVSLFQSTIYKDIVRRHRITSPQAIEDLARYLLSNVGSEYSYRSLIQVLGMKSDLTARRYLGYLEQAFLVFSMPRFSYKAGRQASFNKKIYSIDPGLVSAIGFSSSPNYGSRAENAIAVALRKRELNNDIRLYFWKNEQGEEVDFLVFRDRAVRELVQVCWNLTSRKTYDREVRALIKASVELRCQSLTIITEREEREEKASWNGDTATIQIVPLWKWLMRNEQPEAVA